MNDMKQIGEYMNGFDKYLEGANAELWERWLSGEITPRELRWGLKNASAPVDEIEFAAKASRADEFLLSLAGDTVASTADVNSNLETALRKKSVRQRAVEFLNGNDLVINHLAHLARPLSFGLVVSVLCWSGAVLLNPFLFWGGVAGALAFGAMYFAEALDVSLTRLATFG